MQIEFNALAGNYDSVILSNGHYQLVHRFRIDKDGFSNHFIVFDRGIVVEYQQQLMTALRMYNTLTRIKEI